MPPLPTSPELDIQANVVSGNASHRTVAAAHRALVFKRRLDRLSRTISTLLPSETRSILDIGAGSGELAARLLQWNPSLQISGVDVLVREKTAIPVVPFDGYRLPFADRSVDILLLIDVLHHVERMDVLLRECARVARQGIIIKDHLQRSMWDRSILALMDWIGNASFGVHLELNYLNDQAWKELFERVGLRELQTQRHLGLYPFPANLLFERHLHFVSRLALKH